ncbi:spore coat protein YlbD [Oceanobacillus halophilus]|uniref:Cytosolic protein n=1 Tax=Oceanobacillus halophilus TaxID=930130 RepID=A0A495AEQ8_9BACI|nr:spore coat protein YlbD [Oceanobacillus halophilus]RKQ37375.1 hypothetical protein D8M06_00805 [Oceanobacillus halophilus]
MEEQKLDPTVASFKQFINNHPELRREIRKSGRSWQEYYEKWLLLGEDDPFWDQFKSTTKPTEKTTKSKKDTDGEDSKDKNFELLDQLIKITENIDINKIQGQVSNLSKTIGTVQELVDQFQQSKKETQNTQSQPFNWFND